VDGDATAAARRGCKHGDRTAALGNGLDGTVVSVLEVEVLFVDREPLGTRLPVHEVQGVAGRPPAPRSSAAHTAAAAVVVCGNARLAAVRRIPIAVQVASRAVAHYACGGGTAERARVRVCARVAIAASAAEGRQARGNAATVAALLAGCAGPA